MNPIKKMLRPMTAVMYRSKSVRQWPKLPARLLDIKTPSSVVPKAEDSPSGEANINILLDFVDRTRDIPGSVAECGVFRGESLLSMALYQKQSKIEKHTYGFDSFEGFDDTVEKIFCWVERPILKSEKGGLVTPLMNSLAQELRC